MTNYQRTYSIGEVEVEGSAIYHKTEYRERRNHYAFFRLHPGRSTDSTPPGTLSWESTTDCTRPRCLWLGKSKKAMAHRLESHRFPPDQPAN